jgi:hypothetical protein
MDIQGSVKKIRAIRATIRASRIYPVCPKARAEFEPFTRREYKHSQSQCDRAANNIQNFLIQEIWNIDQPHVQLALKAMQVAYMDMLGMPVYPEGRAWTVL